MNVYSSMKWFTANQAEAASSKGVEQRVNDSNLDSSPQAVEIGKDVAEEVQTTLDSNSDEENGNKNKVKYYALLIIFGGY